MIESTVTTKISTEVFASDRTKRRWRELIITRKYDSACVTITSFAGPSTKQTISIEVSVADLVNALQRKVATA